MIASLVGLALARPAAAQNFPTTGWTALPCGNGVMTSTPGDTDPATATGALDLVGTAASPAGYHAADAGFLYLRMRIAATAAMGMRLQPDAWGYELNLDGTRRSYQLLFSSSGTGNQDQVAIFRHTMVTTPNDPADPADLPPAFVYPFATHGEVIMAGTGLGGAQDFFIDMALPWTDLSTVGVARNTPVSIWAGSSTVANALNLDLACFSGTGPTLGGIDVGVTTPDPNAGGGGGGGSGGGNGARTLEGGPGCSIGASHADDAGAATVACLLLIALATAVGRAASCRASCRRSG